MTDPTVKTIIGNSTLIVPSTGRQVELYKTGSANGTYYSMEEDGVDYVVPAAKKLWILNVVVTNSNANFTLTIYKHTVADTAGGTSIGAITPHTTALTEYSKFKSIEAAKYINLVIDAGTAFNVRLYGVELDA